MCPSTNIYTILSGIIFFFIIHGHPVVLVVWRTYFMLEVVVHEPCSMNSAPLPSKIGFFPQEKCVLLLSSYGNNMDSSLVAKEIVLYAQVSFWSLLNLHCCSTVLSVRKTKGLCLIDCDRRNLHVKIKHK